MSDDADNVVTHAALEAAEKRTKARDALLKELEELTEAREKAERDATIALVVAIDIECAAGLRRKTHHGHDVGPRPPREALQRVDKALAEWNAAGAAYKPAIDAKLAEIEQMNPQFREDMALVSRWLKQTEPNGR